MGAVLHHGHYDVCRINAKTPRREADQTGGCYDFKMMPQVPQSGPAEPLSLSYRDAPTGAVVASDASLLAMKRTRPWAIVCAIFLFLYSLAGGGLGMFWLITLIARRHQPNFPVEQFIIISTANLVFAPLALVGGVLAMRYITAAVRAYNQRTSEDLERAMVAQAHIWRWAGVVVIALFMTPLIIVFIAGLMNVFP
jgi:hypothetical protein